ncbi:MAG: phospholipase [Ardenticatenales bacterium]|nr:phospholipase [Ardenticatenales bacterium]
MPQPPFSLTHVSRPPLQPGEGKAPSALLLHGFGSNEEDLMGLAPFMDPRLHLLSARAPVAMGARMYGWYMIQMLSSGEFHFSEEEARHSLRLIHAFIDEAMAHYDLDPTRLFLVGFSQGAIQSSATLLMAPEKVAGIAAMSGRWPEPAERERAPDAQLVAKPVLVVHGLYDDVIPIRYAHTVKEKFEALPVTFTYQEFPMGHTVSLESATLLNQWLAARLDELE